MLVVADASVLVPALIDFGPLGDQVRARLVELASGRPLHIVHTLTQIEIVSTLQQLAARGSITSTQAEHAIRSFIQLPTLRHDITQSMATRSWELRHSVTAYDAAYVALVEWLAADELEAACLATADTQLANAPGLSIPFEVFEP